MESLFAAQIVDYSYTIEQETRLEMNNIVKAPNQTQQIARSSKAMRK